MMIPTGTCPSCGAPHQSDARVCSQCGASLAPAAGTPLPPPTVSATPPTPSGPPRVALAAPVSPPVSPVRRNSGAMVMAALLAVLALVGIGLVLTGRDDGGAAGGPDGPGSGPTVTYDSDVDPTMLSAGQVLLEPVNQPTLDPFTDDARLEDEEQPTVTLPDLPVETVAPDPAGTSPGQTPAPGRVQGAQPGLYGGTRNNRVCDKQSMIAYLELNPEKASAWAQVQGIAVTDIRAYISALTPVTLTRDTMVTNHGFRNGQPYAHPSVLQAGTAVLIDEYGIPRAKCSCGNPLLPPPDLVTPPDFVGPEWPGFEPTVIIIVVPAPSPILGGITIIDLGTGELIVRPVGADVDTPDLATGAVRVTLTWGDTADLDLAVQDPSGVEINYDVRSSASGGELDVDANSGCESAVTSPAENIVWPDTAPAGQYVVQVSLYDDCAAASPHSFQLHVVVGGVAVPLMAGGDDGVLTPSDGSGTLSLAAPAMYFVFQKG